MLCLREDKMEKEERGKNLVAGSKGVSVQCVISEFAL